VLERNTKVRCTFQGFGDGGRKVCVEVSLRTAQKQLVSKMPVRQLRDNRGRIFSQAGNELALSSFPSRNELIMLVPYTLFPAGNELILKLTKTTASVFYAPTNWLSEISLKERNKKTFR
jgi:hypothetical protein